MNDHVTSPRPLRLLPVLCGIAILSVGCRRPPLPATDFPGEGWARVSAEEAGIAPAALAEFEERVRGSGCVVYGGRMLHEWGHFAHRLDVSSAAKPVFAHLVYKSFEQKKIKRLDAPVSDHTKALKALNPELGYKDRRMTWRHMIGQTACYGVQEAPGTAFNYCDFQMACMLDSLILHVQGSDFPQADAEILRPLLTDLIGCEDAPTINSPHSYPGRLRISPRDFARFGLLYLAQGRWDGRQVLPRRLAITAVNSPHPSSLPRTAQVEAPMLPRQRTIGAGRNQEAHMNSYSYAWWVNGVTDEGTRLLPDLPPDTFLAAGQSATDALVVIPSCGLVVCWIDALPWAGPSRFYMQGRERVNQLVSLLLPDCP